MNYRFKKHYTVEEASRLLPAIRTWLEKLTILREEVEKSETRMNGLMVPGADLGGGLVNKWVRDLASTRDLLLEFRNRELQLKDVDRGLVDFPAVIGGQEVFLCWEKEEKQIEHWHDLDSGYAGREQL